MKEFSDLPQVLCHRLVRLPPHLVLILSGIATNMTRI